MDLQPTVWGDSVAIIFTAQGSSPQPSPVRMAVMLQNAGMLHHAKSSQFYKALKDYDVHNILRQHCKMQGDIIERKMHGLAEWEENFLKNNGETAVFRSTGHSI
jgi:hypothetical protein